MCRCCPSMVTIIWNFQSHRWPVILFSVLYSVFAGILLRVLIMGATSSHHEPLDRNRHGTSFRRAGSLRQSKTKVCTLSSFYIIQIKSAAVLPAYFDLDVFSHQWFSRVLKLSFTVIAGVMWKVKFLVVFKSTC